MQKQHQMTIGSAGSAAKALCLHVAAVSAPAVNGLHGQCLDIALGSTFQEHRSQQFEAGHAVLANGISGPCRHNPITVDDTAPIKIWHTPKLTT
jgi:hypothetical protein